MSWLNELRERPTERRWRRVMWVAVVLTAVPSVMSIAFNLVRTDGLPLISDTDYIDEILVPCPENVVEAEAVSLETLPEDLRGFVVVDARTHGEFLAGHIPSAINIPHRTIANADSDYDEAISGDLQPISNAVAEPIVVCGDTQSSSGRNLASVMLENGFTSVQYLVGGCEAWTAAGRDFEDIAQGVVMVEVSDLSPELEGLVVVDARFSRYYRQGHLPGALVITYRMLEGADDDRLDPIGGIEGTSILVYGSEGRGEGEDLARVLADGGWPGVRCLQGGFEAWEAVGYPIESGDDGQRSEP